MVTEVPEGILPISQSCSHKKSRPANDLQQAICHQPAPVEVGEPATSQAAERVTRGQKRRHASDTGSSNNQIGFKYSIKCSAYLFTFLHGSLWRLSTCLLRFIRKSISEHVFAQLCLIGSFLIEDNWGVVSVMKYFLS